MSVKKNPESKREVTYLEAFLANLSTKLATARAEWPTLRCWSMPSLQRLFREIREELTESGLRSKLSNKSLLQWLSSVNIAREVVTEGMSFHVLEFGTPLGKAPDPLELLMAARPKGVICYLSSVAFHSLTTQQVAHHHVAMLQKPTAKLTTNETRDVTTGADADGTESPSSQPPQLGQILFRYEGTPYYVTKRSSRLVPGVQLRAYGPRVNLRITTYEQTLIDTLYKPFHCGGPEVVFEAWQEARRASRLDEEWLAAYFQKMKYPATVRRTAVMFKLNGFVPGEALRHVLDETREAFDRESEFASISLLPGVAYKNLDKEWLVHTP